MTKENREIDGVLCRQCIDCQQWLPLTDYYLAKGRWYFSRCKACFLAYSRNWKATKKNIEVDGVLMRSCVVCKKLQPLDQYAVDGTRKDKTSVTCKTCKPDNRRSSKLVYVGGVAMQRCAGCKQLLTVDKFSADARRVDNIRYKCKDCTKPINAARNKRLSADPESRKRITAMHREWSEKNKEKMKAYWRERSRRQRQDPIERKKINDANQKWRDKNREKYNTYWREYYKRKKQAKNNGGDNG